LSRGKAKKDRRKKFRQSRKAPRGKPYRKKDAKTQDLSGRSRRKRALRRRRAAERRSAAFGVQAVTQLCFLGGTVNPHRLTVRRGDRVANPVAAGFSDSRCPAVRRAGRAL